MKILLRLEYGMREALYHRSPPFDFIDPSASVKDCNGSWIDDHMAKRQQKVRLLCLALLLTNCCGFSFAGAVSRHRPPQLDLSVAAVKDNLDGGVTELQGPFEDKQLESYWGRRPLLIRGAFDPDKNPSWPSWDDIVSLAIYSDEEDGEFVEETGESARLITHTPGQLESFDVELGPFELDGLQNFMSEKYSGEERWTVLVNDVDRHIPALSRWMDKSFGFLPRWRRDDAQVSIATTGGGIGAHVDNYDVFLIQAAGQRTWMVANDKLSAMDEQDLLIPDIPVSILQLEDISQGNNLPSTSMELQAGDMLYLPPRVVHWGTATTDDCMTLSVGCRAPSAADLLARVAETVQDSLDPSAVQRYTDDDLLSLGKSKTPSLTKSVKESMKELVRNAVENILRNESGWDSLVGTMTTQAVRYSENAVLSFDEELERNGDTTWGKSPAEVLQKVKKLGSKACLFRTPGVSFATSRVTNEEGLLVDRLFAGGEMYEVAHGEIVAKIFHLVEQGEKINGETVSSFGSEPTYILEDLITVGLLKAMHQDNGEIDRAGMST